MQSGDPTAHAEQCASETQAEDETGRASLCSVPQVPASCAPVPACCIEYPLSLWVKTKNFLGAEDLFRAKGVELHVLNDPDCISMMADFIREHPDLWDEDIGLD